MLSFNTGSIPSLFICCSFFFFSFSLKKITLFRVSPPLALTRHSSFHVISIFLSPIKLKGLKARHNYQTIQSEMGFNCFLLSFVPLFLTPEGKSALFSLSAVKGPLRGRCRSIMTSMNLDASFFLLSFNLLTWHHGDK